MTLMSETPDPIKKVTVNHTFSNQFRVLHADGEWHSMGETPFIHLMFFTIRLPLPTETEHVVNPNLSLGEEIPESRKLRPGFDREFQVDVVMTKEKAKAMCESVLEFLKNFP